MDNNQTILGREVFVSRLGDADASSDTIAKLPPVRESHPSLPQPPSLEIHPDLRIGAGEAEAKPLPATKHGLRRLLLVGVDPTFVL